MMLSECAPYRATIRDIGVPRGMRQAHGRFRQRTSVSGTRIYVRLRRRPHSIVTGATPVIAGTRFAVTSEDDYIDT